MKAKKETEPKYETTKIKVKTRRKRLAKKPLNKDICNFWKQIAKI